MRLSDFRDSNGDISHAKFKVTKTPEGRYQIQDMRPNGSTIIIDPSVEHIRMGKDKLTPLILESLIKPEPNPLPPAPPSEYLDTINVDTAAGAMQFGVAEENQVDNPMLSQADMTALATTIETTPHNMGPDYPALPNLFKYLGSVSTDLFAKLTALVDDGENTSDKVSEADLRALANLDQTDNTEGPESQTVINITKKDFDALIAQQ
jgi:hypothetical protein